MVQFCGAISPPPPPKGGNRYLVTAPPPGGGRPDKRGEIARGGGYINERLFFFSRQGPGSALAGRGEVFGEETPVVACKPLPPPRPCLLSIMGVCCTQTGLPPTHAMRMRRDASAPAMY